MHRQETHEEGPTTSTGKRKRQPAKTTAKKMKFDPAAVVPDNLDMTCVHPESYHIANQYVHSTGVIVKGNIRRISSYTWLFAKNTGWFVVLRSNP